jgi:hypothetical protein
VGTDPLRRRASRAATVVAIPVALGAGLLSFRVLGGFDGVTPASTPGEPATTVAVVSPVTTTTRPLSDADAATCRAVVAALPATVAGAARRPVSAGAEQNAAYGQPAVILACGATPVLPAPTDEVWPLSGVCWYAHPADDSTRWTTVDRSVPVSVTVPGSGSGSAQSVAGFSAAIATGDPPLAHPPTGCLP